MENLQKKKGFRLPHVYIIMLILMVFVSILTYVVPAGTFERFQPPGAMMPVVKPGTYTSLPSSPVTPIQFLSSVYNGFVRASSIIAVLLIACGMIQVLQSTGAFTAGIQRLVKRSKGKEIWVVVLFYTLSVILGVLGWAEGQYPFYPIVLALFLSLGYDRMVGTGVMLLALAVGFTSGMMNPFSVGLSQQIAGLPLFSGIGYRFIGFLVFYFIALFFLLRYCIKIKKDPSKSIVAAEYQQQRATTVEVGEEVPFTPKRMAALILFIVTIFFVVLGSLKFHWQFPQICGIYILLSAVLTVLFRIPLDTACNEFTKGMMNIIMPCMVIALAGGVTQLLETGHILDTFVNAMGQSLGGQSPLVTLLLIYIFVTIFNFFIASGSGKSVILMPILSPLGKILNINQQVLVLAYQYGDGFTNTIWPAGTLVVLSMFGISYGQWMKFCWKAYACLIVAGYVLIVIADKIKLGPF
ncbi:MAG: TIGR00366 family protein [Treponema sp.]|jgi:uncharacterized ion transporter superfamily protein YfcC|nr:TIGR00366 family protein [Treponema sp.]